MSGKTKRCRSCAGDVSKSHKYCQHCGEMLDGRQVPSDGARRSRSQTLTLVALGLALLYVLGRPALDRRVVSEFLDEPDGQQQVDTRPNAPPRDQLLVSKFLDEPDGQPQVNARANTPLPVLQVGQWVVGFRYLRYNFRSQCSVDVVHAWLGSLADGTTAILAYAEHGDSLTIAEVVSERRADVFTKALSAYAGPFPTEGAAIAWIDSHQSELCRMQPTIIAQYEPGARLPSERRRLVPVQSEFTGTLVGLEYGNATGHFAIEVEPGVTESFQYGGEESWIIENGRGYPQASEIGNQFQVRSKGFDRYINDLFTYTYRDSLFIRRLESITTDQSSDGQSVVEEAVSAGSSNRAGPSESPSTAAEVIGDAMRDLSTLTGDIAGVWYFDANEESRYGSGLQSSPVFVTQQGSAVELETAFKSGNGNAIILWRGTFDPGGPLHATHPVGLGHPDSLGSVLHTRPLSERARTAGFSSCLHSALPHSGPQLRTRRTVDNGSASVVL